MENLLEVKKDFVMESGRGQDMMTQFQQSMVCLRMLNWEQLDAGDDAFDGGIDRASESGEADDAADDEVGIGEDTVSLSSTSV